MHNLKSIIVVGAGTAGWIAATALKRNLPHLSVSLLYDSKTPTVGVGEALGFKVPGLLEQLLGIDMEDIFDLSNAIYKTGIRYSNWQSPGSDELLTHFFEFGADALFDSHNFSNIALRQFKSTSPPLTSDVWYTMYRTGKLSSQFNSFPMHGGDVYHFTLQNKSIRNLDGTWLVPKNSFSYHYDAEKFGTAISKVAGIPAGVNVIDDKIVDVIVDHNGVKELTLASGNTVSADLFIDCSGFQRLLMNKLNNTWIPGHELYNNAAIVTQLPFSDTNKFNTATEIHSMNHGWRFRICIRNRIGNGYIFNTNFVDPDTISSEFKQALNVPDSHPTKMLRWQPGYFKNTWQKNCVAVGLSMGFIDPIDATNISISTIVIKQLINQLKQSQSDLLEFNKDIERLWQESELRFKTFLWLSPRHDTEHYRRVAQAAADIRLIDQWGSHIERIRQNYFSNDNTWLVPFRQHIGLAVRYGVDLPMISIDEKYYQPLNNYFNFKDRVGLRVSQSAPTAEEYYALRTLQNG